MANMRDSFRNWHDRMLESGDLMGQPRLTMLQTAFEAGWRARKTVDFSEAWGAEVKTSLKPYDLPVPKAVDWDKMMEDGQNWMQTIADDAQKHLSRPGYGPGDLSVDPDSGTEDGRAAYDRYFGAPGPVPTVAGLTEAPDGPPPAIQSLSHVHDGPEDDEQYDDEVF